MAVNSYTIGRDVTVTLAGPGGTTTVIPSTAITKFDAKPQKREEWSRPLNLPPQPLYMPDGWKGNLEVDRQDATLDTFQSNLEATFWAGQNTLSGTVLVSVTEVNGAVTQYRFDGCMFWVDDPGSYNADNKVTQRLEFCAGTRKRVA
jgi:hypothetical protein